MLKKTLTTIFLVLTLTLMTTGAALAGIDSFGRDEATAPPQINLPSRDCSILYFTDRSAGETEYAGLVGWGLVMDFSNNAADLNLDNLLNYDVLIMAFVGPDVLNAEQDTAVETFVDVGGSLYIHQPGAVGEILYGPPGFEITIEDVYWCQGPNQLYFSACLVDGSHPLTAGFTNDDLQGDYDLVGDIGPAYNLLAHNCVCEDPALAVGYHGTGLVVFDTGNFFGAETPSAEYVENLFDYLCTGHVVSSERAAWGNIKSLYR